MSTYRFALAWVVIWSAAPGVMPAAAAGRQVVVVTTSAVEAFDEAVQGIRRGLGPDFDIEIVDLAAKSPGLSSRVNGNSLLIAVGNTALQSASQLGAQPVIATMVLRADLAANRARPPNGAVIVDLSFADILDGLSKAFPGKTRAAAILGPGAGLRPAPELIAQAKAAGVALQVVDCPLPENLIQSLVALREHVDFIWCPPDSTLFNSTTIKPLILASLKNRLPLVGFSASFVRAGGVAGIYPDYFEVGRQTGEMAHKLLAGANPGPIEGPRRTRVATNPRVARLMGLRMPTAPAADLVVIE